MSLPNSLFDSSVNSSGMTSLVIGSMGPNALQRCIPIFQKATQHRLNHTKGGNLFQYGPACGFSDYLLELQKFLEDEYGSKVEVDHLFGTAGATSGLTLAANLLLPKSKGIVFVENPTYFLALGILRDLGHAPVAIPMEKDGIDISAFARIIQEEKKKRGKEDNESHFWAMFYTVPVHHNPTSAVTSPQKCREIIRLAREHDFLVFCDDVYNLLSFERAPKRLFAYDDPSDENYKGGNVISNGSFSKILCPGVRVGWLEMSLKLKSIFVGSHISSSGGAMNNYTSGIIASILKLNLLKEHMELIKASYGIRTTLVGKHLEEGLPMSFTFHRPSGGNFFWIRGPSEFNSRAFRDHLLLEKKIDILPGIDCSPLAFMNKQVSAFPDSQLNTFRISVSFHDEPTLEKCIEVICQELKRAF